MSLASSSDTLHLEHFTLLILFFTYNKKIKNLMICVQEKHLGFAEYSLLSKHKNAEVFWLYKWSFSLFLRQGLTDMRAKERPPISSKPHFHLFLIFVNYLSITSDISKEDLEFCDYIPTYVISLIINDSISVLQNYSSNQMKKHLNFWGLGDIFKIWIFRFYHLGVS